MIIITIGIMGSQNLKELIMRVMDGCYSFVDMEPRHTFACQPINRLYRVLYYTWNLRKVDIIYFIYIRKSTGFFAKVANMFHKKVTYHWAGSDVLGFLEKEFEVGAYSENITCHFAYAPNLQQELLSRGIESKVLSIVPDKMEMTCAEMPRHHAVLLSMPDNSPGRAQFYGYDTIIKVIQAFPNLTFYVVRSEHPESYNFPNVVFAGVLPLEAMNALYDKISIIIRYPKHDGQSLIVMEGTIKGKYILTNHIMPYTIHVETFEQICNEIRKLLESEPIPQIEASRFGIQHYSTTACRECFKDLIDSI